MKPAPGRHRRPVRARTYGPTFADPRHRRDVEPDPPDDEPDDDDGDDAGLGSPVVPSL